MSETTAVPPNVKPSILTNYNTKTKNIAVFFLYLWHKMLVERKTDGRQKTSISVQLMHHAGPAMLWRTGEKRG